MIVEVKYISYHLRIIQQINFIIMHIGKNFTENSLVEDIRNIESIFQLRTIKCKFMKLTRQVPSQSPVIDGKNILACMCFFNDS